MTTTTSHRNRFSSHRTCRVSGCNQQTTSSISTLCARHKAAQRKHGHPEQEPVRKSELNAHLATVRRAIRRNPNSDVWSVLRARWNALQLHARGILADHHDGRPGTSYERQAAAEFLRLCDGGAGPPTPTSEADLSDADKIACRSLGSAIEGVLAICVMQDLVPAKRFASDDAFLVQAARVARKAVPRYRKGGMDGRAELSPRAFLVLGRWMVETFGLPAYRIAEGEKVRRTKADAERARLHAALRELR